ncbi:MAG: phosphate signaling complex protein PhoU [Rickettsiales bacterium]|nr:phosphate signaling complex protein PhoU [Rickettsiales bacterium]
MSLKEHTVKSYDKDLQALSSTLDEMGDLAAQSLDFVAKAIANPSEDLVEQITSHDYKINALDFLVEKKITAILAMRQPMAVDLRYIVSSLKVASNLERIGDQAKSIIKKILRIKSDKFDANVQKALISMLELSKIMVHDAVESFNSQNVEEADDVLKRDDEIDKIYSDLFVILEQDSFDREQVKNVINILFIAKSFERLADHSTNIAEIAKYVVTGDTK